MKLVLLPHFRTTRDAQLRHIARNDPQAAVAQGDRIMAALDHLPQHPEMGRVGRVKGTRELVVGGTPFIVIYRVKPKAGRVEVLRVLHGAQRWPAPEHAVPSAQTPSAVKDRRIC